ncbi:hypothetical protein [Sutcliffiella cohnii]|uniref:hypothetical protein n=1 Tax=Sutcliffiella cohnii TaxID=33932 RepID=UPI002E221710|nr:hypothetical protein [Sutcliffiella cohnii]
MVRGFAKSFEVAKNVDHDFNELHDLVLTRYSDMTYILSLDVDWVSDLLMKAIEKRNEEELWELYLVDRAKMNTKEQYMTFNEYKEKAFSNNNKQIVNTSETIDETFERITSGYRKQTT